MPFTINDGSATDTYANITNISKTTFQNQNVTMYVKGKWLKYNGINSRIFCFCSNLNDANNYMNICNQDNTGKNITIAFVNGGTQSFSGSTGAVSMVNPTDYIHTFIRFNASTNKVSFYFYSIANTLLYNTAELNMTSSTIMNNYTIFSIGREMFNTTRNDNIGIGEAGWYSSVLDTTTMQQVVAQSPN
jgi:hypothetical protein